MVFVSQTVAVLLVIAVASISVRKFDNTFGYTHERLGLALWILVWIAPLIGLVRPNQYVDLPLPNVSLHYCKI